MRCVPYWPRVAVRLSAPLVAALLAGGASACDSTTITASATPQIARAVRMTVQRACHSATRLQDGRVLVVGGFKVEELYLTSAELYDPATHAFVETGYTAAPRTCHSATLLQDGKALIASAYDGALRVTEQTW